MKKHTILKALLIFLITSNFAIAQNYIKAVCTLKTGESLNGLVKNNFQNDDDFIFFKENDQEKKINIKDITELLVDDKEKYISKNIFFHPNRFLTIQQITDSQTTDLTLRSSKQVLLKLLVTGDINLYQTNIGGISLYYFNKGNDTDLEYLEYYKYKTKDNLVKSNTIFQRTLLKSVNCNNQIINSYQYIDYDKKDLLNTVNKHNLCVNGTSTVLNNVADNQNKFRLSAFGGVKMVSGTIGSSIFIAKNEFSDKHTSPNLGVEFSYLGASRSRKSEIFTRLDYSTIDFFQSAITNTPMGITSYEENVQFESSILGFLLGYRYNFNSLEDANKGNFGLDFGINASIPFNQSMFYRNRLVGGTSDFGTLDLTSFVDNVVYGFSFGTSYTYLKKYTIEARYTTASDYTVNSQFLSSEFSNFNIGFKYLILD